MQRGDIAAAIASRLSRNEAALRTRWDRPSGTTTRHCFLDDVLPEQAALAIYAALPSGAQGFHRTDDFRDRESVTPHLDRLPPIINEAMFAMQASEVLRAVQAITGIAALEPDPLLYAGGVAMMFEGDFLNPHIDNSHDAERMRYRRVNLLYYVTPGWREEYGGNLELWNEDVTRPVTIPSLFNRLVLMETTPQSWHSVSPVRSSGPRCALRNFYFSRNSPKGRDYCHVTSFTGRPEQKLRRAWGMVDNSLRNLARKAGLRRSSVNMAAHAAISPSDTSAA